MLLIINKEIIKMTQQQWKALPNGEKAWRLNLIMGSLNDEEAYYSGWLYIWPDGESYEDCLDDFGSDEDYNDLEQSFKRYYSDEEIHDSGLYFGEGISKEVIDKIIEDAHFWDETLGLPKIEVL
jgi:hypothetical protein